MSIPVVAFFNNKGGVGKTTLVYHLAWMLSDLGVAVLAADLDPQANLSAAFFDEVELENLWTAKGSGSTVYSCITPLIRGVGDIAEPAPQKIADKLTVLPGDLALSTFEDELSVQWGLALNQTERPFRVLSAFWRILQRSAESQGSKLVLMDLGPNLGSINRAALTAADFVVVPLSPDLFSLQGLRNLGPAFERWRQQWKDRLERKPEIDVQLPAGRMEPLGYVILQHSVRLDRPVKAYDKWIRRIPHDYAEFVLRKDGAPLFVGNGNTHELAKLKHYRSLMPMAQEARKPVFHLKPADGAIGAHYQSALDAREDFEQLARRIAAGIGLALPD